MKSLPLHDRHKAHGANWGEFAGFSMPLYYTRPLVEHHAVRQGAGVFDISHMGQFTAEGGDGVGFLQFALTNDVRALADGGALYSLLCREDGGVLDDLIVYRHSPSRFRIIVNAATREKDFRWLAGRSGKFGVTLTDVSADWCLLAVQGPEAFARLAPHCGVPPATLGYYTFTETKAFGVPVFLARTGYTGEPGCEIAVPVAEAERLWQGLTGELEIPPIGLAARDTLRLEACMALYGHELREEWHPLESGVGWAVRLEGEEDFIGKAALKKIKEAGPTQLLAGLEATGRGLPRSGYPVLEGGKPVGAVTSGGLSPTTGKAVALAHLQAPLAKIGTALAVEIRGKAVPARVVRRPFYRNPHLRD